MTKQEHLVEISNAKTTSNDRWWEFYLVRYFVGTVVGVVIISFLNFEPNSALYGKILPNLKSAAEIDFTHYLVLGAIGLAFCYIASAPILVLHSLRGLFQARKSNELFIYKLSFLPSLLIILVTLTICLTTLLWYFFAQSYYPEPPIAILIIFSLIFSIQLTMLMMTLLSKNNHVFNFYKNLAELRAKKEQQATYIEYIESYKHLREHGNAFFILFMELCLAGILYTVDEPIASIVMIALWIIPAFLVWFIGSYLEASLAKII